MRIMLYTCHGPADSLHVTGKGTSAPAGTCHCLESTKGYLAIGATCNTFCTCLSHHNAWKVPGSLCQTSGLHTLAETHSVVKEAAPLASWTGFAIAGRVLHSGLGCCCRGAGFGVSVSAAAAIAAAAAITAAITAAAVTTSVPSSVTRIPAQVRAVGPAS